jgi:hypothetical protein
MPSTSIGALIYALNLAEPVTIAADSPYEHLHHGEDHSHSASNVYPTLAAGVTVESDAVAWTLGAFVEIVPVSTITSIFDIHHIHVESITANDTLELVLYYGAGDTEAGRVRITQNAVMDSIVNVPFQTPLIPANSRIRAKVASATGGTDCTISIKYHTY